MDQSDIARINQRYDSRLQEFGEDDRVLASGPPERHRMRYRAVAEIGIASGDSVLDVGCGFGGLHTFLAEQGVEVDYCGYDINPSLIEVARRRRPNLRFELCDVQKDEFPEFDWIVGVGMMNHRTDAQDNYQHTHDILSRCHAKARKGVAFDFQSSYVDFKVSDDHYFYYEPEKVFALAKTITKRVALRHDYPLFEFAVYLYPDFTGWRAGQG